MVGVVFNGMFVSYLELGYDSLLFLFDFNGVILLDDLLVNEDLDLIKYFNLDDYIIDIIILVNRVEINLYYVFVMELVVYYKIKFVWLNLLLKDNYCFRSNIKVFKNEVIELIFFEVRFKNNKMSLKDILFLVKYGINVKGFYVIDLINIVFLVVGVLCYVYDKNKIGKLLLCFKFSGEFEILGGKKVSVFDVFVIKDEIGVIFLVLVMGCENLVVDENIKEVVFEVGLFDLLLVRYGVREIKMDIVLLI